MSIRAVIEPRSLLVAGIALALAWSSALLKAADATFFRAINLNGPALTIDGRHWEAGAEAKDFKATGKAFENQKVLLKPATDTARAQMIRSSVWGDRVDLVLTNVPPGAYQVFLYVWEDNHSEKFSLLVNDRVVVEEFHSGSAGMWRRLGPWRCESVNGKFTVSARGPGHGAANLSGLEIWAGDGPVPQTSGMPFASNPTADQVAFFESKIRPALIEHCYECHSVGAKKIKGGLVLDSRAGVQKGGDTGAVITPGDPDASLLIQALRHVSEDIAMPPKKKLPPEVIADFEQWVRLGAPDPRTTDTLAAVQAKEGIDWAKAREWWSLRPLTAPPVPKVKDARWAQNDVDRFILAKIEEAKLNPASDADKRTLIRRATYDLTGLPPTPEEVTAFLADKSPRSFAKVVDRLLASPRYGERWGRHWLDVVRYADTAGDNSDYPIPQMHRYRDWVIAAFNRDLPYDQFIREQLAGDLLGGATDEERFNRIIATGYIANARRFGSRVDDYPQHLTIEDTLDNVGRAFLGLTLSCARCHDHKFDPVTTRDYYALYGIFHSTRYPWPGIELDKQQRDFVPLVPPGKLAEAEKALRDRENEQQRLDKEVQRLKDSLKNTSEADKAKVQEQIKQAEKAARDFANRPSPVEMAYAVAEGKKFENVALQQKGDPAKPGPVVPRGFLTVLGGAKLPPDAKTSGRAQLAEWIVARDNPLTARVMVNRLWLHHFGRGLVPTPNDLGKNGKPPTHPELLDYLAAQFRDGGWSVKAMHRLIMLSHTYQLGSDQLSVAGHQSRKPAKTASLITDPLMTDYYGVFPRRRLDAEAIRDTLLVLGGNLDLSPAGAHPFPPPHTWDFTQHKPFKAVYESNRRSVYLMTQRIQRHPFLAVFDGADPSTSTPLRMNSTTPLQALWLLNDSFVHEQAGRIATRLLSFGSDERARVQRAYELCFARPPLADEVSVAQKFLADARAQLLADNIPSEQLEPEAWRAYVRVLFRLNEFVYVD